MKKLNKFLSGILSIAMVASCICTSVLAEAAPADVSGSEVTVISTVGYANDDWVSNDVSVGIWGKTELTAGGLLSVPINVLADGAYKFSFEAICSAKDTTWFSPIEFKIDDDGTYNTLDKSNVIVGDSTGKDYGGEGFKAMDYIPEVNLTSGPHTLYFLVNAKRGAGDCYHASVESNV